jgi:AbiV family abortive infection protein
LIDATPMMVAPDPNMIAAVEACVVHARHLLDSAKAVQEKGFFNIAYHLATLALEELGRREMIQVQSMSVRVRGEARLPKATDDHVKKLFWCFYRLTSVERLTSQEDFFRTREDASIIHANRIRGLYVDYSDQGLSVPSEAISEKQADDLINLAGMLVQAAEAERFREDIPEEELALQTWFLNAFDDPQLRNRILTQASFAKLRELQDAVAWTKWNKSEAEREAAQLQALAEAEIRRLDEGRVGDGTKEKWKVQLRLETHSHFLRRKPFAEWNSRVGWIKLNPVQGQREKVELIVELTLGDNIPIQGLFGFGLSIAKHVIVALNLATSGFWWWVLPRHKSHYYERITDLESGQGVDVRTDQFKVFHDNRPPITDVHIQLFVQAFTAVPGPGDHGRGQTYAYYLGGLTFMSLSDIHFNFDGQSFGNFLMCMKGMMGEASYLRPDDTASIAD